MVRRSVISQTIAGGAPAALIAFAELQRIARLKESAQKCEWASKQLQQLRAVINASHFDTDYISILRAALDRTSGRHIYTIAEIPPMESYCTSLSLIAADLIGNLRSSLEYLTWQLANEFCNGLPPDPKAVQFPICDKRADYEGQERLKKQVHPDAFSFIERYQPYRGINGRHDSYFGDYLHPLAHLRNLSNEEKHRVTQLFLMLPSQISFGPVKLAGPDEEVLGQRVKRPIYDFIGTEDPIYLGMPVLSIQLDAEPDVIERAGSVIPHIAMPGNRPMLESIERLLSFVHMILSDCARDLP
jgi:hypothetical protein